MSASCLSRLGGLRLSDWALGIHCVIGHWALVIPSMVRDVDVDAEGIAPASFVISHLALEVLTAHGLAQLGAIQTIVERSGIGIRDTGNDRLNQVLRANDVVLA